MKYEGRGKRHHLSSPFSARDETPSVTSPSMNTVTQTRINKLQCQQTNLCAPIIKRDFWVAGEDQSNQTQSCGYGSVCHAAAYKGPWIMMKNPLTLALSTPTLTRLSNQIHSQNHDPPLCHLKRKPRSNLHIRNQLVYWWELTINCGEWTSCCRWLNYFHKPSVHYRHELPIFRTQTVIKSNCY